MSASPNPLAELVCAEAARAPWHMDHRRVSACLFVTEGALSRWLKGGPVHRNPSAASVSALRALLAKLEAVQ